MVLGGRIPKDAQNTKAETLFIAAAGNAGNEYPGMDTIIIPGAAKNVLTVGGSLNIMYHNIPEEGQVDRRFPLSGTDNGVPVDIVLPAGLPYEGAPIGTHAYIEFSSTELGPPVHQINIDCITPSSPHACLVPDVHLNLEMTDAGEGAGNYYVFDIEFSVTNNPTNIAPDNIHIYIAAHPTVPNEIELMALRQPGSFSWETTGSLGGFISGNDFGNQDANPVNLFGARVRIPKNFEFPSRLTIAPDNRFRSGLDVWGGSSFGVDISELSDTQGPPQKRIKPDVIGPASSINAYFYFGENDSDNYYGLTHGTSMATGMTSGLAQLSHFFLEHHYERSHISPALLKAYIVHTAKPLDGLRTGPNPGETWRIPSPYQGFGRINVDYALLDIERYFVDQSYTFEKGVHEKPFSIKGHIVDDNVQTRITLAWTDAPASSSPQKTAWEELLNDLDLLVRAHYFNGSEEVIEYYTGNYFQNVEWSELGDTNPDSPRLDESVSHQYDPEINYLDPWVGTDPSHFDRKNNVECIFLPRSIPAGAKLTVSVRPKELHADSLDVWVDSQRMRQDFALVVANFKPVCMGDANGDGNINLQDFITVRDNFGNPNPFIGDANHDGVVNLNDFVAVRDNFGRSCDGSVSQTGSMFSMMSSPLSMTGPSLSIVSPSQVHQGNSITVEIRLDAEEEEIGLAGIFLQYDPNLVSFSGGVTNTTAFDSSTFNSQFRDLGDIGVIAFSAGASEAITSDNVLVATLEFQALETGDATFSFSTSPPTETGLLDDELDEIFGITFIPSITTIESSP